MAESQNTARLVMPPDLDATMGAWGEAAASAGSDLAMMVVTARTERDALATALGALLKAVQGNSTWAVDDLAQDRAQEALERHEQDRRDRPAPRLTTEKD